MSEADGMSQTESSGVEATPPVALPRKRKMRRLLGWTLLGTAAIATAFGCSALWAIQKTQEVPDFYVQAASRMPTDVGEASRELQHEVEELTAQVGRVGGWAATFTESQINAWLVHQLPKEFSKALPAGVAEPRVVIEDGKILAAARYKDKRIETVVSFELGVQVTPEPNVLAIEVRQLKAGALPLPLGRFVEHISKRAAKDNLEVRWDTNAVGLPIALLTVPSTHHGYVRTPVIVESVTMTNGRIRLTGHTGPEARVSYQPQGPIYRLASHRSQPVRRE